MEEIIDFFKQTFLPNVKLNDIKTKSMTLQKFNENMNLFSNNVAKLLIKNYLSNNNFLALQLLDKSKCSKLALYLKDNIYNILTEIDIKGKKYVFDDLDNKDMRKKFIYCDRIVFKFIRIFNVLATLLINMNPENNFAIDRISTLYESINDEQFKTNICKQQQLTLLQEKGFMELINMFMYDLIVYNETDKKQLETEYNNMLDLFSEILTSKDGRKLKLNKLILSEIKSAFKSHHKKLLKKTSNGELSYSPITNNSNKTSNANQEAKQQAQTQEINELQQQLNTLKTTIETKNENSNQLRMNIEKLNEKISSLEANQSLLKQERNEAQNKYSKAEQELELEKTKELEKLKKEVSILINETKKPKQFGGMEQSINNFKDFLSKYSVNEPTLNKIISLMDSSLKMNNTPKRTFCSTAEKSSKASKQDNASFIINYNLESSNMNSFFKTYNDLDEYYKSQIEKMSDLLKRIVDIKENPKQQGDISNVVLKQLSNDELKDIETECRSLISNYIVNVQRQYLKAVEILTEYLNEE